MEEAFVSKSLLCEARNGVLLLWSTGRDLMML
jgi:hypothetical protein